MKNFATKIIVFVALMNATIILSMDESSNLPNLSGVEEITQIFERDFGQDSNQDQATAEKANVGLTNLLNSVPDTIVIVNGRVIVNDPKQGCIEMKQLILEGADINAAGKFFTPSTYAVHCECAEFLDFLIGKGADLSKTGLIKYSALFLAVNAGNLGLAKKIIATGVPLDYQGGAGGMAEVPLMTAVRSNNLEMVDLLIEAGADRTITNPEGQTALDIAIELQAQNPNQNYKAIIDLLTKNQKIK